MATHPVPTRLIGFAAALESAGGTPETISLGDDAIQLAEPTDIEGPLYLAENKRVGVIEGHAHTRGAAPSAPSGRFMRLPFRVEARGAGSAYSASNLPPEHVLLVAAGFSFAVVTTSGSESVTYTLDEDPNTGTDDTLTVQFQKGNREFVLTYGVVEGLTLEVEAPGIAYWSGTIVGIYSADTEQALEDHSSGYSSVAPAKWNNASPLSIGGVSTIIAPSMTVTWGRQAIIRPKPDATGIAGIKLGFYDPTLSLSAETLAKSTWDPDDDFNAVTQRAIDATIGGTQYYRLKLNADAAYVDQVVRSENNDLTHYEVDYSLRYNSTATAQIIYD